jgi:hypothetical protein
MPVLVTAGDNLNQFKLLDRYLKASKEETQWDLLLKTFCEAMSVVEDLSIYYISIDFLFID